MEGCGRYDYAGQKYSRYTGGHDAEKFGNPKKVYIGNLPPDTCEDEIRRGFTKFGEMLKVQCKGRYAFVEYASSQSARDAMKYMDGGFFLDNRISVHPHMMSLRGSSSYGYEPMLPPSSFSSSSYRRNDQYDNNFPPHYNSNNKGHVYNTQDDRDRSSHYAPYHSANRRYNCENDDDNDYVNTDDDNIKSIPRHRRRDGVDMIGRDKRSCNNNNFPNSDNNLRHYHNESNCSDSPPSYAYSYDEYKTNNKNNYHDHNSIQSHSNTFQHNRQPPPYQPFPKPVRTKKPQFRIILHNVDDRVSWQDLKDFGRTVS